MRATLKELRLTDFGPLQGEKIIKFGGPGTYAICAPNGKGKSHIIQAAKIAAVPGTTLDKPMGAYVYGNGAQGVTKAQVHAEFDFGGEPLSVTRTFSLAAIEDQELAEVLARGEMPKAGSKTNVKWKGEAIKATADASELLTTLLGIDNKVQEDAVFVNQNQAGEILRIPPSARSKALQFLCGAEVCQKAADTAQRKLSMIKVVDRKVEIEAKTLKLAELDAQIKVDEGKLAALIGVQLDKAAVDAIRQRLEDSSQAQRSSTRITQIDETIARLTHDIKTASLSLKGLQDCLELVKQELTPEFMAKAEEAIKTLASAEANASIDRQRLALYKLMADLEAEPDVHRPPAKPDKAESNLEILTEKIGVVRAEKFTALGTINTFKSSEKCPTCGLKPTNRAELIADNEAKLQVVGPRLDEYVKEEADLRSQWTKFHTDVQRHKDWEASWAKRVENVTAQLSTLGTVGAAAQDTDKVKEVVEAYKLLQAEAQRVEREQLTTAQTISHLQRQLDDANTRRADESRALTGMLSPEELKRLQTQLLEHEGHITAIARLQGALGANKGTIGICREELTRLQTEQAAADVKLRQVEFLEGIKGVMHHSAIPHDRSIAYLQHLNTLMAQYCEILHAPFTLSIDPETQQFMQSMNGQLRPIYQLSGGQFTIASWAWHLSLYEKHGAAVGFLFMDEPTVGLDDVNLSNVGEAVEHLAKFCRGSGLQFVMVTHERDLASVFDEVISI